MTTACCFFKFACQQLVICLHWYFLSQILRASTRLTSGVLFIPIVTNALRPLECQHTWLHTGWACYQSAQLALVIISICLLAAFVPLTLLGEMPYYPHARVSSLILT